MVQHISVVICAILLGTCAMFSTHAADSITNPASGRVTTPEILHWSQFRGPNSFGVAADCRPPVRVQPDRVAWRLAASAGKSSPAIWGDKLFFTAVDDRRLVTIAVEVEQGKLLWKASAPEVPLERVNPANSAASSTPCVDGQRVYAYFGSYGVLCYDHAGTEVWKKALPTPQNMYGVSISPILHEENLILLLDDDANLPDSKLSRSRLVALNKTTGDLVWETPRPYNRAAWSTPVLWRHELGTDIVALGNGRMYGYDAADGSEKWYVSGFAREPIGVPVVGSNLLYASVSMQGGRGDAKLDPEPFWAAMTPLDTNGDGKIGRDEITEDFTTPLRPELPFGAPGWGVPLPGDPVKRRESQNKTFDWRDANKDGFLTKEEFVADMTFGFGQPLMVAVRPGGTGDVTSSHVQWSLRTGIPEIPSPLYYEGRLYLLRDGGILTSVDAVTGSVIYRKRLGPAGQYSASPVLANRHLYLLSNKGSLSVVKAGDEFQIVHQAELGSAVSATPAFDARGIYIRTSDAILAFR